MYELTGVLYVLLVQFHVMIDIDQPINYLGIKIEYYKVKDLPIINKKNDKSVMTKYETTRKYFFFRNILYF